MQFPQPAPPLTSTYVGVAVGHTTGEPEPVVYIGGSESSNGVVAVFGSSGGLLAKPWTGTGTPAGSFAEAVINGKSEKVAELEGVAVDDKATSGSDWAAGDVYVATRKFEEIGGTKEEKEEFEAIKGFNVVDVFKPEVGGKEGTYLTALKGTCPNSIGVGGECTLTEQEEHPFKGPRGVAVDQSNGDVLVADAVTTGSVGVVDVFEPTGMGEYSFVRQLTGTPTGPSGAEAPLERVSGVAVDGGEGGDGGDIYVSEGALGVVYQFNAAGEFLDSLTGTPAGPFGFVRGVAVDPASHNVFVGSLHGLNTGVVDVFGPDLVVPDVTVTGPVSNLTPTSATLHGTVNPVKAGEASCEFEFGTSTSYGRRAPCAARVPEGNEAAPVESKPESVTELEPDTTYHYRLDAINKNGTNTGQGAEGSQDLGEFTTPGPGIHSESVSEVKSTSATFEAAINPHNAPTTYYFQYGPSTGYGEEAPLLTPSEPRGAVAGSGEGDVQVSQHVQVGLSAGTVYHYRVVAVSEAPEEVEPGKLETRVQPFYGSDQTFTTQPASSFALPDGRAWEMVSPPDKHGALIYPINAEEGMIQASAAGSAMTYATSAPTEAKPPGYADTVQVLSTRGQAGWGSRNIATPHSTATGQSIGNGQEYRLFSSDLSLAVVQPFGAFTPCVSSAGVKQPCLSEEASEQTAFFHTNYVRGDVSEPCTSSCYRPLVTSANVPAGVAFGEEGQCPPTTICGPRFVGATSDLSHVVISSQVPLASTSVKGGLYEWSDGKLALVSVLPGQGGPTAAQLGDRSQDTRHAISDDGSRIVWESGHHLYLRENAMQPQSPLGAQGKCTVPGDACTVQLDAVQGGDPSNEVNAVFQAASSDGTTVFFTDNQRLTNDSGARNGFNQGDLYECTMVEEGGELKCRLTDLTPSSSGESADVQGAVLGSSEDGSFVYFVANGALAPGALNGAPNLYVRHSGTTKLIAVLSGGDSPDWAKGEPEDLNGLTARVSPDGRWLAFMSQRSLTGYDSEDVTSKKSGERLDEEVYLYDASSERLVCASCNPTGARPVGVEYQNLGGGRRSLVGGDSVWENTAWLAANIPGWTPTVVGTAPYQSRYLSDSGRLFFNSNDALVPQDVNGTEDVYQYEPPGVGSCTSSAATFSERSGGCVGLISSGRSSEESAFLDASATGGRDAEGHEGGGDVFFLTAAKLSPQDFDTSVDVYDAHECSSQSPCFPPPVSQPPPCSTEASCKAAPSQQPGIFGSPSSATFSGPGNLAAPPAPAKLKTAAQIRAERLAKALKACRAKRSRHKRVACEAQVRKRYGPAHKAKKSTHHQGSH